MDGIAIAIITPIFFCYAAGYLLFTALATRFQKTPKGKFKAAIIVFLIYTSPISWLIYKAASETIKEKIEYRRTYPPAKALFDELCKTAKENIYKTMDNVDGVLLLNIRKGKIEDNRNPNWPDAASGYETSSNKPPYGEEYIRSFLGPTYITKSIDQTVASRGYSYVDVKEEGRFWRYRYGELNSRDLIKEPSPPELARYAVDFKNDVNPEHRKHWVAGTTVTVIDTWNQEIIAEKTWYAFAIITPRMPEKPHFWSSAYICAEEKEFISPMYRTRKFVDKVLQPN